MQEFLDDFLVRYDQRCPHQGRCMNGRPPAQAFVDGLSKVATAKGGETSRRETYQTGRLIQRYFD
jgi:hypothetical protein